MLKTISTRSCVLISAGGTGIDHDARPDHLGIAVLSEPSTGDQRRVQQAETSEIADDVQVPLDDHAAQREGAATVPVAGDRRRQNVDRQPGDRRREHGPLPVSRLDDQKSFVAEISWPGSA
jgi:hypothetical protein